MINTPKHSFVKLLTLFPSFISVFAEPVVVNSQHLGGYYGCTNSQQRAISDGWSDAVNLAKTIESMNFTDPTVIDLFGSPDLNQDVQSFIQDVFTSVGTFDQGWHYNSSNWSIEVSCSDDLSGCRETLGGAVYTKNLVTTDEILVNASMVFCPDGPFFNAPSLNDLVSGIKTNHINPYDLNLYRNNTAYYILHEMMLVDGMAMTGDDNSIYKLRYGIAQFCDEPSCSDQRTIKSAYGAIGTRILARGNFSASGITIAMNADTYAECALAQYVTKAIGEYPWLPVVPQESLAGTAEDISILVDQEDVSALQQTVYESYVSQDVLELDGSCNADIEDDCALSVINFTQFASLPPAYINQYKTWVNNPPAATTNIAITPSILPEGFDYELKCAFSEVLSLVNQTQPEINNMTVEQDASPFCQSLNDITLGPAELPNGQIPYRWSVSSSSDSSEPAFYLVASWAIGDPGCQTGRNVSGIECYDQLLTIVRGCEYTIGMTCGGWRVNDCVIWSIVVEKQNFRDGDIPDTTLVSGLSLSVSSVGPSGSSTTATLLSSLGTSPASSISAAITTPTDTSTTTSSPVTTTNPE